MEFRRSGRIRQADCTRKGVPCRNQGCHLLWQVRRLEPQHVQHALAPRSGGIGQEPQGRTGQAPSRGRRRTRVRSGLRTQALGECLAGACGSVCRNETRRHAQVEDMDQLPQVSGIGPKAQGGPHLYFQGRGLYRRDTCMGAVWIRGRRIRSGRTPSQTKEKVSQIHPIRQPGNSHPRRQQRKTCGRGIPATLKTHGRKDPTGGMWIDRDGTQGWRKIDRGCQSHVPWLDDCQIIGQRLISIHSNKLLK
mmetsp:Transcript_11150/g.28266  ORF Transcript_11150/g.28266 Transcript_11150/m.28266 type:complete len:249 (+) Transcript_11150:1901-2647(+)